MALDLDTFWRDDEEAHRDNCFFKGRQTALGIRMSGECVFAELSEPGDPWVDTPRERRLDLNRRYNDKAEKIVGKRLLPETLPPEGARLPYVRRIGEAFGGEYIIKHQSEWLTESVHDEISLEKLLDRVERMDYRAFMLPDGWEREKKRVYEQYGVKPAPLRHIRGPVTLACSIFGSENLIYLILDEPDLAKRFSSAITHAILSMAAVMDEEAGVTPETAPGFSFADDNCCLLNPDMYELFGYPVLEKVFSVYAPKPGDSRYQHSDSAMEHLLPILGRLNFTGVNFGPTVLVPAIRKYLPNARIDGCIAPLTFMRNEREALIEQVRRDCRDDKRYGGVNLSCAGSINNGSSLESMRLIMEVIREEAG